MCAFQMLLRKPTAFLLLALLLLLLGLGGCATQGGKFAEQSINDRAGDLKNAAAAVTTNCGPGSPLAQAALDSAKNIEDLLKTFNAARDATVTAHRDLSISDAAFAKDSADLADFDRQIALAEAASRDTHAQVFVGPVLADDINSLLSQVSTLVVDISTIAPAIVYSSNDAERADAAAIMAQLPAVFDSYELHRQQLNDALGDGKYVDDRDATLAAGSLILSDMQKLKVIDLSLKRTHLVHGSLAKNRECLAHDQQSWDNTQAAYQTAKDALESAMMASDAILANARAAADACAQANGTAPPTWPDRPAWSQTFWDISSN